MNFSFIQYPSHNWLPNWTFEPGNYRTNTNKKENNLLFLSDKNIGEICPNIERPEWSLQIPLPKNCPIKLLFNGFCGYFKTKKKLIGAEVFMPEAGVILGQFDGISSPVLRSERIPEEREGYQWIDEHPTCALLAIRGKSFCLVTKHHVFPDAKKTADRYLKIDFAEMVQAELVRRDGVLNLFENMKRHDELAAFSAECLMRGLRAPEGELALRWSQSAESDSPLFSLNELYPLVLAWRHIDCNIAEELVLSALSLQTNNGALPAAARPHGAGSTLDAPKPLIVQACERVWETGQNPEFLAKIQLPLKRYLQWMIRRFDPKRRGLHHWQSEREAFISDGYQTEMATVDLTALLLCEIDALNRLASASESDSGLTQFTTERNLLKNNLLSIFWDEQSKRFNKAFVHDKAIHLPGFPALVPLLWTGLAEDIRSAVLAQIAESDRLPGGQQLLSWKSAESDKDSYSILQQVITLEAFRTSDTGGQLFSSFSQLTLQGYLDSHATEDPEKQLNLSSVAAALVINLQAAHHYGINRGGRVINFMLRLKKRTKTHWMDLAIVAASIFCILAVHTIYKTFAIPDSFEGLRAKATLAHHHTDWQRAYAYCEQIIRYYPDQADESRLMAANILICHDLPEKAEPLFVEIRASMPDTPSAMVGLGLAQQLQGKHAEAIRNYDEFIYLFDDIFPDLVETIETCRGLAAEGFDEPPKWKNIYGYKIMHEL